MTPSGLPSRMRRWAGRTAVVRWALLVLGVAIVLLVVFGPSMLAGPEVIQPGGSGNGLGVRPIPGSSGELMAGTA